MTALVFAPPAWQFVAFPLVVPWQSQYEALAFYFPGLHFGRLEGKPKHEVFQTVLELPRQKGWQAIQRDYQPGELSQWQAYVDFLATQEYHDETDLKAAIRGQLEPVLPEQVDGEMLWSLAYQLEQMLIDEAKGLQHLADQQQALEKALGEVLGEDTALAPLDAAFNPSLTGGQPDLTLARVRWQFWRRVLAPHLTKPWAAVVLEGPAKESSPRHIWEAAREDGGLLWQAEYVLPDWRPQPGLAEEALAALQVGVAFRKTLGELLHALQENPGKVAAGHENMLRLAEEELWPTAGLPRNRAIRLEVFGWLKGAEEVELVPEPMVFLSPAG
jgi:hypothetical protein